MNEVEQDRTLALAGMFQAATLAQQLARRGYADEIPLQASVRSILITDAVNTLSVFGGLEGIMFGLNAIREKTTTPGKPVDFEVARYVLDLSRLQAKLARDSAMIDAMTQRIEEIKQKFGAEAEVSNECFAELAQLYRDTISTMKPKIIVQGEHGHLANPQVVDKVRTALLAGVRAAFLWGQLGGRRWHLVFSRKSHLANANEIVRRLSH